jgi:type I restriction enzyme, R subunit
MGMSEADTRANLIDPVLIQKGWVYPYAKREESGKAVDIVNGQPRQRNTAYVDYVLRVEVNSHTQPVAVALLEAKAEDLPPDHGLEQAKAYTKCKRFNVPFIYASNGHRFVEYDRYTGLTSRPRPMGEFPTRTELRARYEAKMGFSLDEPAARPLITPYMGGEAGRRYYQDAAIRAVLEKIVRCEKSGEPKRALLSLATGSGKTFIAVNLLKRIADAGQLRRALFVCDRDELRAQAHTHLQNVFGADAAEVYRKADGTNNAQNARIHIATYQTLGIDLWGPGDQDLRGFENPEGLISNFLTTYYPPDYFSHIIIDECHRSAWGKWSQVLTRNPNAVQVGLTATPRQLVIKANTPEAEADAQITADNLKYFGEPVYEYDLAQGIEDGYLAACEIQKSGVDIDDTGITLDDVLARKPVNARTGQPVTREELEELYNRTDYEDRIQLPDRVMAMCHDLFNHLLKMGGPEQKTVIFCVRDTHADAVASEMNNLYAAWCAKNGQTRAEPYAFKCTAAGGGHDYLPDLRGSSRSHFIATTVELLTTGVDVPALRNVAFFRYMKSPISFYQMVGRGTRLDPGTGKLMFHVYDYTDATRLFGEDFFTRPTRPLGSPTPQRSEDNGDREEPLIISVEGFEVHISEKGRYVVTMTAGGKAAAVPVEEYKAQLAERLKQEAPTLDDFRARWIDPRPRRAMVQKLVTAGYSPSLVRAVDGMSDYDLFDVLAKLTYRLPPQTRRQRADSFHTKEAGWLKQLPARAAYTLTALTAQFARAGIEGLESTELFETGAVKKAGGLMALKEAGQPAELVRETKARLFS